MRLVTQEFYSIYQDQHAQNAALTHQKVIGHLLVVCSSAHPLILDSFPPSDIPLIVRCSWQIIHGYGAPIGEDLLPIRR